MRAKRGFTLIELLIVVAIIGILAAIAVPNFLNAQIRAKIARTYSDLKALSTAMDAYFLDCSSHPNNYSHLTVDLKGLTTPVSYITNVGFIDVFWPEQGNTGNDRRSYLYFNYYQADSPPAGWSTWMQQVGSYKQFSTKGYCLSSWGPDRLQQAIEWVYIQSRSNTGDHGRSMVYAPSNGLKSAGDIGRWGGNVTGVPTVAGG